MDRELLKQRIYDWDADPNDYRIIIETATGHTSTARDPNRCHHCGLTFLRENDLISYCGICSKAMSSGGETYLAGYNVIVEKSRITIPDEFVERIDWNRFNIKMVITYLKSKFELVKGNRQHYKPIFPQNLSITFDEIKHIVPMLQTDGSKYKAEFHTADGYAV